MNTERVEKFRTIGKLLDIPTYAIIAAKMTEGLALDLLYELPHHFPFGSHIAESTVPALAALALYVLARKSYDHYLDKLEK